MSRKYFKIMLRRKKRGRKCAKRERKKKYITLKAYTDKELYPKPGF